MFLDLQYIKAEHQIRHLREHKGEKLWNLQYIYE